MKAVLLRPLMFFAMAGLLASLAVHIFAWLSIDVGGAQWILHVGVFIVFIPCIFLTQQLTKGVAQSDFWKAALRGCPRGMILGFYGLGAYAFLNFFLFMFTGNESSAAIARGFSSHWMVFYFGSFAIVYSALHVERLDGSQTCVNGHTAPPLASFCPRCGAAL